MSETRAVSTTLGYVLTLAIAALLVTGLIAAGTGYVETEREQVIRDELTVIGQQLAADVERADRLVRAANTTHGSVTVRLNQSFSDRVTGSSYRISLESSDEVVVTSVDPNVTVTIDVETKTDISDSTVDGGGIRIAYDETGDHLEVRDV